MIEEDVREALRDVVDPEVGINVVDLGLVYGVEVDEGHVRARMTMTTPACPLHGYLTTMAESAIRTQVPEVRSVSVELVWDPPWSPEMISEAARRQLGWSK
jgi:metal-sulfur cluster biosynthetic enzyme